MEYSLTGADMGHPSLDEPNIVSQPKDTEATIWRYTSLAKLLNIVRNHSDTRKGRLVFPRADILEDEYEGTLSEPVKARIKEVTGLSTEELNKVYLKAVANAMDDFPGPAPSQDSERPAEFKSRINEIASILWASVHAGWTTAQLDSETDEDAAKELGINISQLDEEYIEELKKREKIRNSTFLNCWRLDEYESSNMWHAYTSKSDGVAIKTTFEEYCKSFIEWNGALYIGNINYIDYLNEDTPLDPISPFFYKRPQFSDESEVRAICTDYTAPRDEFALETLPANQPDTVRELSVDLDSLIQEIVVHPHCGRYLPNVVEESLAAYDISCNVQHSSLRAD